MFSAYDPHPTPFWPIAAALAFMFTLVALHAAEPAPLPQGLSCDDVRRIVQTLSPEERAYYAKQLTPEQLKAVKQCLAQR